MEEQKEAVLHHRMKKDGKDEILMDMWNLRVPVDIISKALGEEYTVPFIHGRVGYLRRHGHQLITRRVIYKDGVRLLSSSTLPMQGVLKWANDPRIAGRLSELKEKMLEGTSAEVREAIQRKFEHKPEMVLEEPVVKKKRGPYKQRKSKKVKAEEFDTQKLKRLRGQAAHAHHVRKRKRQMETVVLPLVRVAGVIMALGGLFSLIRCTH